MIAACRIHQRDEERAEGGNLILVFYASRYSITYLLLLPIRRYLVELILEVMSFLEE
jgi:hypothetical protein